MRIKFAEIVQDGRDNACRAVGRCGDDAAAGGIGFIDRQSIKATIKIDRTTKNTISQILIEPQMPSTTPLENAA